MVEDIGHKLRASASREQGRAKTWRKYAVWFPCFRHREIPTWGFATRGNQSAPLRQRRGDQTEHLRQFFRRRSAYSRPAPSDVPPEPGRAARARSRIGRELRVSAKPERIMGAKEVSERRRGAAIAPPSDQAALGPCRVRNKGQDGVHQRRAASAASCERQRAARAKKRSGPAEGAAGPEGGGMRLSQEPRSAFQRQSRQVIGGGCLTCWTQYTNHP